LKHQQEPSIRSNDRVALAYGT